MDPRDRDDMVGCTKVPQLTSEESRGSVEHLLVQKREYFLPFTSKLIELTILLQIDKNLKTVHKEGDHWSISCTACINILNSINMTKQNYTLRTALFIFSELQRKWMKK